MAMVVVVVVVVVVSLGAHIGRSNEFIGREVWVWVYGRLIDPSFPFFRVSQLIMSRHCTHNHLESAENIADASRSKALPNPTLSS